MKLFRAKVVLSLAVAFDEDIVLETGQMQKRSSITLQAGLADGCQHPPPSLSTRSATQDADYRDASSRYSCCKVGVRPPVSFRSTLIVQPVTHTGHAFPVRRRKYRCRTIGSRRTLEEHG